MIPAAPLFGAAYLVIHVALAGLAAARDRKIQGIEAGELANAIQVRFADEVRATGELLVGAAALSGALLGALGAVIVLSRAKLRRRPASALALLGVIPALHASAFCLAVAYRPQLYASLLYDQGGALRLLSVTLTDTLGVVGTAVLLVLVWLRFVLGPIHRDRRPLGRLVRIGERNAALLAVIVALAALVALFPGQRRGRASDPKRRPNVLILAADSLRPDRLDDRRAPALAALVREAVSFDRAHVTIARTFPSWVTILTGRFPHVHGVRTMFPSRDSRSRDFDAVPQRFARAGYDTFAVSDYAGDIFPRVRLGFSTIDTPTFHFGQVIRQRGIEAQPALLPFLDNRLGRALVPTMLELNRAADADDVARRTLAAIDARPDRPFFGVTFFSTTHFPYASPSPGYRRFTDPAYRGRFKYEKVHKLGRDAPPDEADIAQIRGLYDGAVSVVDRGAARVLAGLAARGLADDTIVVILADHGEDLFEGGRGHGHGDHLFGDESSHVPLVIRDGRAPRAARVPDLVRDVDLAPTLYDLAGIEAPGDLSGRSLTPLLRGETLPPAPAYAETDLWFTQDIAGLPGELRLPYPDIPYITEVLRAQGEDIVLRASYEPLIVMAKHRSIVVGDHKLVIAPTRRGLRTMLFDLKADQACLKDIAAEQPETTARLRTSLLEWVLEDRRFEVRGEHLVPKPRAFGAESAEAGVERFDAP